VRGAGIFRLEKGENVPRKGRERNTKEERKPKGSRGHVSQKSSRISPAVKEDKRSPRGEGKTHPATSAMQIERGSLKGLKDPVLGCGEEWDGKLLKCQKEKSRDECRILKKRGALLGRNAFQLRGV